MDDLYNLCSAKLKGGQVRAAGGGDAKKKSGKKAKVEDESLVAPVPVGTQRGGGSDNGSDPTGASRKRSTRSSPSADEPSRPRKKHKTADTAVPVHVLKVPPSEFPKEMFGAKDLDPSAPEDLVTVFTPDGHFPVDSSGAFPADLSQQKYQAKIDPKPPEGNFFHCVLCQRDSGDEFICCKQCPRAFHKKCFEKQNAQVKAVGGDEDGGDRPRRECRQCEWDCQIRPSEDIAGGSMKVDKKLQSAYGKYKDTAPSFTFMAIMMGTILQILEKLKQYDYGAIFADPGESCRAFALIFSEEAAWLYVAVDLRWPPLSRFFNRMSLAQ